ncbi:retrovirus-related pol polyprotein from transposon TNT 1-94 [Tanacetum coccineum]
MRPNGDALRKCILEGPYQLTTVTVPAVPATNDSPAVPKRTTVKTLLNMSSKNKEHYQSEKEAIHLLLIGIGDEIYSTVESLNIQDVKTNLFWEFVKFTSHDGESMESYYSRFYKMINEMIRNNLTVATMQVNVQFLQQLQPELSRFVTIVKQNHDLETVSYHKLFDVLKQYQKEINEIRAGRIAKNANPLALVAAAPQYPDPYYEAPKSHKSYAPPSKQSYSTRSNASTKFKGREIAKPITPLSESASEEDSDPEQAQRDNDMQKNLALIAKYFNKIYKPTNNNLRTSSNSKNKNVDTSPRYVKDNQIGQFGNQRTMTVTGTRETIGSQVVQQSGIQCFNCKEFGHFAKECRKLKRVKDYTYHKEKMLLCKQSKKGIPLQVEQANWLEDTDEEIDEQELEAHYGFMVKIQEVLPPESNSTAEPLEQTELEKYMAFNDRIVDYDKLECKLNETQGLLAQKEIDIKEGLVKEKTKKPRVEASVYGGIGRSAHEEPFGLARKNPSRPENFSGGGELVAAVGETPGEERSPKPVLLSLKHAQLPVLGSTRMYRDLRLPTSGPK